MYQLDGSQSSRIRQDTNIKGEQIISFYSRSLSGRVGKTILQISSPIPPPPTPTPESIYLKLG